MRITFVINSLEGGGAERVLATVLQEWVALAEAQVTLRLILLDDLPMRYKPPAGVPVRVLDSRQSLWRSIWNLQGALRSEPPDLVISFLNRANYAAILAAKLLGLRVLVSERVNTSSHFASMGLRGRVSKALVRLLYPRADGVIAVSQGVARDLHEHFGVAEQRLQVIYNPYDIAALKRQAAMPPEVDLPSRFFVGVGRLTRNKNFALLLQAYARLATDVHLVILGAGDQLEALQQLSSTLGTADRVHFKGFVQNPHAVVARALAFVSSSDAEGFPNAAAEAMAVGTPVVMTDCPSGPAELLGGQAPPGYGVCAATYGLLVPAGDCAALTEAMGTVLRQDGDDAVRQRAMALMATLDASQIVQRYVVAARAI